MKYYQFRVGVPNDTCKGRKVIQVVFALSPFSSSSFRYWLITFFWKKFWWMPQDTFFVKLMRILLHFMLNGSCKGYSGLSTRNLTCIILLNVLHDLMRWELFSLFRGWGNWVSESLSDLLKGFNPTPVWPQSPWASLRTACSLAPGSESKPKPKDLPHSAEFWEWRRSVQKWPQVIKTGSKQDHSLNLLQKVL